jgi:Ser-tRNA(Ala) deacylase AlaX
MVLLDICSRNLNLFEKDQRIESRPSEKIEFDQSLIEKSEESSNEEREKKEKEHNLWVERERLAQIEWKAKKEKEERENMKKSLNVNKVSIRTIF